MAVFERKHTVMAQARRAAPDHNIAMMQQHSPMRVGPRVATEQENRRQSERYRNDGCAEIAFVLILMQREARAGFVAIEQTRVGNKYREFGCSCCRLRQLDKCRWHRRPGAAAERIARLVTISR